MSRRAVKEKESKPRVILAFGEDLNDLMVVRELVKALRPSVPAVQPRRRPLVLIRGENRAHDRKNAADVSAVVKADGVDHDVRAVIAHKDCDDFEPAHVKLAAAIERAMRAEGVPEPIACTPAWEMEAWWFLWPEAVAAAFPSWRKPDDHCGREVGRIRDAKEELQKLTKPPGKGGIKSGFSESDAPRIAAKVRELGVVGCPQAKSESFEAFRKAVTEAKF